MCYVVSLYPLWWWHFVFCCHSFNCRCSTDIYAISEQCGVSRLVVAAVLPMVDSAADFNMCSTDDHHSLSIVLLFTSEMESDTAARNIARYGSFTSKSVLYRTCLGISAFSIQPQTLNTCLRSSFATSNRWSLWSSVPEYDRKSVNSLLCVCGQITKSLTLYIGTTWPVVTPRRCPFQVVLCRAECWNAVLQMNRPCTARKSASAIPFMLQPYFENS